MEVTEVKNKISRGVSLIDESLSSGSLSGLHISIHFGIDGLGFCILDTQQNNYLALETYTFQGVYTNESLKENIESVFSQNQLLQKSFKSASVAVVNNKSTLVPVPLFDPQRTGDYFKFNHDVGSEGQVMTDNMKNLDAKNVYIFPTEIKSVFEKRMPGVIFRHYSTPLIDSLLLHYKNHASKKVIIHIQLTHFEVVVTEGKNLLFYNSFNYTTAEDFMYYLLFVFEQLKLNPETADVSLVGEIERNSTIYSLLNKYVRNVKFGERPESVGYSYKLNDIPKHFYYNIYSQHLCV